MNKQIVLIENYICKNLQKKLDVADLAKQVNFSSSHFSKFFKKHFKKSPNRYIKEKRLEKAREMLESKEVIQIKEIALAVGFNTPNYFVREFTKKYQVSPKEYEAGYWGNKRDNAGKNNEKSETDSEKSQ